MRRLATYYEAIGVKKNDYYKEELGLLCSLAERERVHGWNDRSDYYIKRAEEIEPRLNDKVKTPSVMTEYFTQKSMNSLTLKRDPQ